MTRTRSWPDFSPEPEREPERPEPEPELDNKTLLCFLNFKVPLKSKISKVKSLLVSGGWWQTKFNVTPGPGLCLTINKFQVVSERKWHGVVHHVQGDHHESFSFVIYKDYFIHSLGLTFSTPYLVICYFDGKVDSPNLKLIEYF